LERERRRFGDEGSRPQPPLGRWTQLEGVLQGLRCGPVLPLRACEAVLVSSSPGRGGRPVRLALAPRQLALRPRAALSSGLNAHMLTLSPRSQRTAPSAPGREPSSRLSSRPSRRTTPSATCARATSAPAAPSPPSTTAPSSSRTTLPPSSPTRSPRRRPLTTTRPSRACSGPRTRAASATSSALRRGTTSRSPRWASTTLCASSRRGASSFLPLERASSRRPRALTLSHARARRTKLYKDVSRGNPWIKYIQMCVPVLLLVTVRPKRLSRSRAVRRSRSPVHVGRSDEQGHCD